MHRVAPVHGAESEASVWRIPSDSPKLLRKIRKGTVTRADLAEGGATQLGAAKLEHCGGGEYEPGFPSTGNWTDPVYAVSVPGVLPSTCIDLVPGRASVRPVGKAAADESRMAARRRGDARSRVSTTASPRATSATRSARCRQGRARGASRAGASTILSGNVAEIVGDWDEQATTCGAWLFGDTFCSGGPGDAGGIGSPARGGYWDFGFPNGGIFHYNATISPAAAYANHGFRCVR